MKKFLHELMRRDVVKVGAIYLVVAWLLVQITIAVAPALFLPEWTDTLVIFLLALGFPVALILSWAYDLSPKGITPTRPETSERTAPATAVAVGDVPFLPPERSIAVLPFVNMSNDPEQEYFSDGISEELLNGLAKIGSFRVAARTSSFAFKGKQQDISQIGKALNVGHVLEGSVRKADEKVRITAQLIVTETGYHLWSETYDRALEDVFAIQDEISASIVGAMREHILGEDPKLALTQKVDVQAFELYLKGRQLIDQRGLHNILAGKEQIERALTIAPDYVPAIAGLAESYLLLISVAAGSRDIQDDEAFKKAKILLDRAIAIDPHSAEVHSNFAGYYNRMGDVATALKHIDLALQANPSYAPVYGRQFFSRVYSGNPYADAYGSLRRNLELDPADLPALNNLAFRAGDRLNPVEFEKALDLVKAVDPRTQNWNVIEADAANHRGDIAESLSLSRAALEKVGYDPAPIEIVKESFAIMRDVVPDQNVDSSVCAATYLCGADKVEILAHCRRLAGQKGSDYVGFPVFEILRDGWGGNESKAKAELESFFKVDGWGPMFMYHLVALMPPLLAYLRRKDGDEAGAQLVIAKLKEYMEIAGQDPIGPYMSHDLLGAAIAALDGDKELALERLQSQVERVWYLANVARADPVFELLRDDPRFDAINAAVDARCELERGNADALGFLPYDKWIGQYNENGALSPAD